MDSILRDLNPVFQLLLVMALFSLMPFVFCCMTSFLRYSIVFSVLKQALGTQQVPPSMVLVGLSIILTFYSMGPVFSQMWEMGSVPYQKNGDMIVAIQEGAKPLREFMLKQTRQQDLEFFVNLSKGRPAVSPEEITIWEAAPAYIVSELKTAFEISFLIFVPFIVLNIIH